MDRTFAQVVGGLNVVKVEEKENRNTEREGETTTTSTTPESTPEKKDFDRKKADLLAAVRWQKFRSENGGGGTFSTMFNNQTAQPKPQTGKGNHPCTSSAEKETTFRFGGGGEGVSLFGG